MCQVAILENEQRSARVARVTIGGVLAFENYEYSSVTDPYYARIDEAAYLCTEVKTPLT